MPLQQIPCWGTKKPAARIRSNTCRPSGRADDNVLRIARTIADIEKPDSIEAHHVAEAIQYRRLDRKL